MKNLMNLNGVKTLNPNEQKAIHGGKLTWRYDCAEIICVWTCENGECVDDRAM